MTARIAGTSPITLLMMVFVVIIALPILGVIGYSLSNLGTWETLSHLMSTVLGEIVLDTLLLCAMVSLGVCVIGVGTAWLTTAFTFPGRQLLSIALLLPLAMPAYVMAYAYTDFLQFAGPVQTWLRDTFALAPRGYWFPEVRSLPGAGWMFILVLYPYVYLLARASFVERSQTLYDAARTLGCGPWRAFWRVSVPLVRPAVAAGTALVVMETLADFGTVAYFGVTTFTTAIYRAWFNLGDRAAAAQMAVALLAFVVVLVVLERHSRGESRFHGTGQNVRGQAGRPLRGMTAAAAMLACAVPSALGFWLPAGILVHVWFAQGESSVDARYMHWMGNTMLLAGITAALAVALAVLFAHSVRTSGSRMQIWATRVAGLGYAVPGTIIAVGILIPVAALDNAIDAWARAWWGKGTGLLLVGTAGALIYAYLVRFYAVAAQTVEAGYARITPSMEQSARSLGLGAWQVLRRVHAPLLTRSMLAASLLVFVDVMKELPATLIIRPFNFDTLAVIAYQLASDERLAEAALPALSIVMVGIAPVVVLARAIGRSRG